MIRIELTFSFCLLFFQFWKVFYFFRLPFFMPNSNRCCSFTNLLLYYYYVSVLSCYTRYYWGLIYSLYLNLWRNVNKAVCRKLFFISSEYMNACCLHCWTYLTILFGLGTEMVIDTRFFYFELTLIFRNKDLLKSLAMI